LDAFVTKLNAAGTALAYSTYLGGSGIDGGFGVAVDGSGHAYATGITVSANFPTTAGAFQTTFGGGAADGFAAQLNSTGTALVYSTYLGGTGDDEVNELAVDGSGNAYIPGLTDSANFPTTAGAFQTTLGGSRDAFVAKLNAAGTALVFSTYFGPLPDRRVAAWATDTRLLRVQELTRPPQPALPLKNDCKALAVSPDGRRLAVTSDWEVLLFDITRWPERGSTLGRHQGVVSALAFGPDGRTLYSGDWTNAVRVWDVERQTERARFTWPVGNRVTALAVSPDGLRAAAGGDAGMVAVSDLD
jgi:WD40 repeat protein